VLQASNPAVHRHNGIVATLTALGFYLAQRKVTADAERNLQENFQAELSSLHKLEELRHAALAERCDVLAAKPRIHAAMEDNAIDLLYPSAKDELRDLMEGDEPPPEQAAQSLHARFYRFLDSTGAVIKPLNPYDVGELDTKTETQLALSRLPDTQQIGYIRKNTETGGRTIDEVIAVPIFSSYTGDVISALVIGFKPLELEEKNAEMGMRSGVWVNGQLHLLSLPKSAQASLNEKIASAVANSDREQDNFASMSTARLSSCFTSGLILVHSFRPLTKFAFIRWPIPWLSCIACAGRLAAQARCFC